MLPIEIADLFAEELIGIAGRVARHRYGCRILCRLLEYSAASHGAITIVNELLKDVIELCRHTFAHHVMQAVIEHGSPAHRRAITHALMESAPATLVGKNASYVLETAITRSEDWEQHEIISTLLRDGSKDAAVHTRTRSGRRVLKALVKLPGAHVDYLSEQLHMVHQRLGNNSHVSPSVYCGAYRKCRFARK